MKPRRLYRVLSKKLPKPGEAIPLNEEESHYVVNVLRLPPGSIVEAVSGSGQAVMTILVPGSKKNDPWKIQGLNPEQRRESHPLETVPVTLYLSVLKSEAMDWIIEKSVELGVQAVQPVVSERSLNHEPKDRWQKRADQALKQCERLKRMEVKPLLSWEEAFRKLSTEPDANSAHWVARESRHPDSTPDLGTLLERKIPRSLNIWIGPEGGWSPRELDAYNRLSVQTFSLGPLILRAETAAIACAAIVIDFFRRTR